MTIWYYFQFFSFRVLIYFRNGNFIPINVILMQLLENKTPKIKKIISQKNLTKNLNKDKLEYLIMSSKNLNKKVNLNTSFMSF